MHRFRLLIGCLAARRAGKKGDPPCLVPVRLGHPQDRTELLSQKKTRKAMMATAAMIITFLPMFINLSYSAASRQSNSIV